MDNRSKDYIRGRRTVLDNDQLTDGTQASPAVSSRTPRRSIKRLVPLFIFGVIALLIAREEVPAVSDAWERTFNPEQWLANKACQTAALDSIERKEFARILKRGEVNRTTDGLYIDNLVIGEMSVSGNEVAVEYTCYLNGAGELVNLNRIDR